MILKDYFFHARVHVQVKEEYVPDMLEHIRECIENGDAVDP